MSTDRLVNGMKAVAGAQTTLLGQSRWGIVTSTRGTDTGYEVKVRMQPEDVLSGWLPVLSPFVGGSWGLVCPPAQGQQVFVTPDSGDHNHGVVVGMAYSTSNPPPTPGGVAVKPGQFALVHKNGSYLVFDDDDVILVTNRDLKASVKGNATVTADRGVVLQSGSETSLTVDGDSNAVTIQGDLFVSKNVTAAYEGAERVDLLGHDHHYDGDKLTTAPVAGT